MSKLNGYFKNKNFEDALLKQLKELSMHANTAILHLHNCEYNDLYCEIFIIEAIARSLRILFDAIISREMRE
ncbi:MAG: hypothetical protein DRJ18_01410 [Candidatus Methanomethylicota archaeon]|nr:MAG: hypothetical protein DRJ18_01410 [Candidatus Verstraetearchaeota archaeon]